MRVVQASVFVDPLGRGPQELLDTWSGLTVPAEAATLAGCSVTVVQAANQDATVTRGLVTYEFIDERPSFRVLSTARRKIGLWAAELTPRVLDAVASLDPDVVHLHGMGFPRHLSRLVERVAPAPVLVQDHADRPARGWGRTLQRRALAEVGGVIFTARAQSQRMVAAGVISRETPIFEVLESTSHFTPGNVGEARRATGLLGDPCLLWIGRLDANKDPLMVLDAFALAAPTLPDARLWMCYQDAPLLASVQARLGGNATLRERVTLLGPKPHSEVQLLLRAADFLVLGSHHEGSGYAVLEALASGTTPLVTDIPSFRRITGDGTAGALTQPEDAEGMSRAIIEWSTRDRTALRSSARAHFEANLSLAAIGRELRSAYDAVRVGVTRTRQGEPDGEEVPPIVRPVRSRGP